MKHIFITLILLNTTLLQAIEIKLNYTPIANLVYQLDCISGAIPSCSDQNYNKLWDAEFIKVESDKRLISQWADIMDKYKVNATLAKPQPPVKDSIEQSVDLSHKVRMASFEAKNVSDYLIRLDLVMQVSDRIEVTKIINHFSPRFDVWWNKSASRVGSDFMSATDALLKKKEIIKKINQFVHFYEATLPNDFSITLNFFLRPELAKESTNGQQLDNHSVTEFLAKEDPKQRLDVILHELCHFLFKSAEPAKFTSLKSRFNDQKNLQATGAYNITDESLAAALGNGLINKVLAPQDKWEKYLAHKNSFYNDEYIDTAAKSILPLLETWLEQNKTLYDPEFIPTYVAKLNQVFGSKLESPQTLLRYLFFIYDENFDSNFEKDLHKNIFLTSAWWGDWKDKDVLKQVKENPNVTTLVVLTPNNLSCLKQDKLVPDKDFQTIKKHLQKNPSLLYAARRSPSALIYIIVAKDHSTAVKQIERLAKQESGFVGLLK